MLPQYEKLQSKSPIRQTKKITTVCNLLLALKELKKKQLQLSYLKISNSKLAFNFIFNSLKKNNLFVYYFL